MAIIMTVRRQRWHRPGSKAIKFAANERDNNLRIVTENMEAAQQRFYVAKLHGTSQKHIGLLPGLGGVIIFDAIPGAPRSKARAERSHIAIGFTFGVTRRGKRAEFIVWRFECIRGQYFYTLKQKSTNMRSSRIPEMAFFTLLRNMFILPGKVSGQFWDEMAVAA